MRIYRREGTAFWWWSATVKGVRIRESTGLTDRVAAEREARTRLRDAERRVADAAAGIRTDIPGAARRSVADITTEYLADAALRLSKKTWVAFSYIAKAHVIPHLGATAAHLLTKEQVLAWRSTIMAEEAGKRRAKTINNTVAVLRLILKFGVERTYIASNVVEAIEPIKVRNQAKFRALPPDQVDRWLARASRNNAQWVRFMLATGLRDDEAKVLCWRHIQREHSRILIAVEDEWSPKAGKSRYVPLTEGARAVLDELGPGVGLIWGSIQRRHNLATAWRKAGLEGRPATAHDLRHTCASMAASRGLTLTQMMEWFGWTSASVAQRYLHLYGPAWKEMAEKMAAPTPSSDERARATIREAVAALPPDVAEQVLAALRLQAVDQPPVPPTVSDTGLVEEAMTPLKPRRMIEKSR